jgi:hypothetical protein
MGAEFDAQDLILAGSAGFVAINNEDSGWSTTFATSLLDGAYCDVISTPVSRKPTQELGEF